MIVIDNKFNFGDIVYLKTDTDQRERIVTAYCLTVNGVTYELKQGNSSSWHYDYEISIQKNVLLSTTN
jgi:hypothetical protein